MSTEFIAVVLGIIALIFGVLWKISRSSLKALKLANARVLFHVGKIAPKVFITNVAPHNVKSDVSFVWIVGIRKEAENEYLRDDPIEPQFYPQRRFATEFSNAFAAEDALTALGYTNWSYA